MKQLLEQYIQLVHAGPPGLFSRGDMARLEDHIEDGLQGARYVASLQPQTVVDIGSGGGIPAIPIASECASAAIHLVESLGWKAQALTQFSQTLNLDSRLSVHCVRVEEAPPYLGRELIDVGTARALAAPPVVAEYLAPLIRVGGHLALWTTRAIAETSLEGAWLAELGLGQSEIIPASSRLRDSGVILSIPKVAPCPERYPRRVGVAVRRPLS